MGWDLGHEANSDITNPKSPKGHSKIFPQSPDGLKAGKLLRKKHAEAQLQKTGRQKGNQEPGKRRTPVGIATSHQQAGC